MVKRILALDVGERRIGVAVSDLLGITAQGVETIFTEGLERDLKRVGELARQYETDQLLLGLPMRMSGEEGLQAGRVRAFAERLSEMGLQVRFQDERLTSVSAERVLIDAVESRLSARWPPCASFRRFWMRAAGGKWVNRTGKPAKERYIG